LRDVGAGEALVKVQPVSNRRLDGISRWLINKGFPLTRENWCSLNWGFDKTDEEIQELVEGRGDAEELVQIPRYLSGEDEDGNPILSGKKAKIILIKP